ncbi:MAG: hypothetical protein DRI75_08560 [Bacteroidetes bacterium]|nr:MAG: hypothetical protein DRI75_08560 [Bacteroidota bacterium]
MESIKNSIRIGVTGHRSLDDLIELKKQIIRVLEIEIPALLENGLFSIYKKNNSNSIFYSVLTSLAEGADRLVAKTITDYTIKSSLEIVLPLTIYDYKKTFKNPDDPQFIEFLKKANSIKKLRKNNLANDIKNVGGLVKMSIKNNTNMNLNMAFEDAGRYIVNSCDILLVLWNGKKSGGVGGTYEIYKYAISVKKPIIIISTNYPFEIKKMNCLKQIHL